jgi:hypothetical protein
MRIVFKRYKLHGDRTAAAVLQLLSLLRPVLISGARPATTPFCMPPHRLPVLIYPSFGWVFYFFLSPSTTPFLSRLVCPTNDPIYPLRIIPHYTTAFPEVRRENVFSLNFTIYVKTRTHARTYIFIYIYTCTNTFVRYIDDGF